MTEPSVKESMSYKLRKEAFVSNLSGSSILDINLVTYAAASAVFLWTVLAHRGFIDRSSNTTYILDFLINVCSVLGVFTIYSSTPLFLNLALLTPAILLLLPLSPRTRQKRPTRNDATSSKLPQAGELANRPFLTHYRGTMLLATSLAILAVDFRVFPRRFAKVESWGTSLMDLGVGSFVFSAGVVAARTVIKEKIASSSGSASKSLMSRMVQAGRHSLPLLVLGVIRLVSVKGLDYAEHVTEYGVHWNFFFTLAFLPPFVEICDWISSVVRVTRTSLTNQTSDAKRMSTSGSTINSGQTTNSQSANTNKSTMNGSASFLTPSMSLSQGPAVNYPSQLFSSLLGPDTLALLITMIYEIILNKTSLLRFILIAPRTSTSDLLTKNREGIFSFFGYLSIFLLGRSTGETVCSFQTVTQSNISVSTTNAPDVERRVLIVKLLQRTALYCLFLWISISIYGLNLTVSRRLANLPYALWIAAYNNAQILVMAVIEHVAQIYIPTSSTMDAHTSTKRGPSGLSTAQNGTSRKNTKKVSDNKIENARSDAGSYTSPILAAFNRNGLLLFLLANLGTGLVNLSVDTLGSSHLKAMGVLVVYAGVLSIVAILLDKKGIKLKL